MRKLITAATCAAFIVLPGPLSAENAADAPSASNLKGPPNANGYGKSSGTSSSPDTKAEAPSASNMKGPPNANGYQKQ